MFFPNNKHLFTPLQCVLREKVNFKKSNLIFKYIIDPAFDFNFNKCIANNFLKYI